MLPWAEGVCDAMDAPEIRKVVLMWGTRCGKTQVGTQWMQKIMDVEHCRGLFVTATEALLKRTVRDKFYPALEKSPLLRRQLLPRRLRSPTRVQLTRSTWHGMWFGSPSQLADTDAKFGWANEVDKPKAQRPVDGQSRHGDELDMFFQRFKEYSDHKILVECSPSLEGHSRIAKQYAESNQCRYYVPCPHCSVYFVLKMGTDDPDAGGIKFDKTAEGKLDVELARQTARYICHNKRCRKEIHNEHRTDMMRCGKWAPKGCRVNSKGRVCGKPERPDCTVWGGQLSSLYSLFFGWGDIAAEFVKSRKNSGTLQSFVTDWLSETWKPHRAKSEPEDVAERIAFDDPPGVIPEWATWRFDAVDVQEEYFKWLTVACGPGERVSIVDRGSCDTWEEVYAQCVDKRIPHADGKGDLLPALVAIDDGHRTPEVHGKCKEWGRPDRLVLPFKGSNTDLGGEAFTKVAIGPDAKGGKKLKRKALRARLALVRIRHNPFFYEPIIQKQIDQLKPGDEESLSVPAELANDLDFIRELCNGVTSDTPSKMSPDKFLWAKRWEDEANDFRDCLKMARCGMDVKFRGDWRRANARQLSAPGSRAVAAAQPVRKAAEPEQRESSRSSRIEQRRQRFRVRRERMRR
jgi:phage terminase large subunit GpA-like protein